MAAVSVNDCDCATAAAADTTALLLWDRRTVGRVREGERGVEQLQSEWVRAVGLQPQQLAAATAVGCNLNTMSPSSHPPLDEQRELQRAADAVDRMAAYSEHAQLPPFFMLAGPPQRQVLRFSNGQLMCSFP